MKTPKQFARHYLFSVLGNRNGCDIKERVDDYGIIEEIVDELADLIEKREREIVKQKHLAWTKEYLNNGSDAD